MENNLANDSLHIAKIRAETTRMEEELKKVEDVIQERNALLNRMEQEIVHSNIKVQRKQNQMDILNRKLARLIKERGVGLSQLSLTIYTFALKCYFNFLHA